MTSAMGHTWEEAALVGMARKIVAARRLRTDHFPPTMFVASGWDILLALYLARDGADRSLAALAEAVRAPLSTAARWVDYLEQQDLVVRDRPALGGRLGELELTDKAYKALHSYLRELLHGPQ
jgi:DNA-binding MarR family transcriptional regulator